MASEARRRHQTAQVRIDQAGQQPDRDTFENPRSTRDRFGLFQIARRRDLADIALKWLAGQAFLLRGIISRLGVAQTGEHVHRAFTTLQARRLVKA
jgi:hypothetical protein